MRSWMISTSLALSACAHLAPQPSTMPTAYVMVAAGSTVPDDGFFLTVPGARATLTAQRMLDLDKDAKLAGVTLERDDARKQLKVDDFCRKWCLEIGLVVGGIAGGAAGYAIGHH